MTYKLLLHDTVLLSQPLLIKELGRGCAQFLSQLHYWSENTDTEGIIHDGHKWIYNSQNVWAEQMVCSSRTIRTYQIKLALANLIFLEKLSPNKSNQTYSMRINYEELYKMRVFTKDRVIS